MCLKWDKKCLLINGYSIFSTVLGVSEGQVSAIFFFKNSHKSGWVLCVVDFTNWQTSQVVIKKVIKCFIFLIFYLTIKKH